MPAEQRPAARVAVTYTVVAPLITSDAACRMPSVPSVRANEGTCV